MKRVVVGRASSQGHPAMLDCGHGLADGGTSVIGAEVSCSACDRLEMPADLVAYKQTPLFTASTLPPGLLRDHSTKRGVWARIQVHRGALRYHVPRLGRSWDLAPGHDGIVAPEDPHHVECLDAALEFQVQFYRPPG